MTDKKDNVARNIRTAMKLIKKAMEANYSEASYGIADLLESDGLLRELLSGAVDEAESAAEAAYEGSWSSSSYDC